MRKSILGLLAFAVVFGVAPRVVFAAQNKGAPTQAVLAACDRTAGCVHATDPQGVTIGCSPKVCFTCKNGKCVQTRGRGGKLREPATSAAYSRMRRPARHPPTLGKNRSTRHRSALRNLSPNGLVASINARPRGHERGQSARLKKANSGSHPVTPRDDWRVRPCRASALLDRLWRHWVVFADDDGTLLWPGTAKVKRESPRSSSTRRRDKRQQP